MTVVVGSMVSVVGRVVTVKGMGVVIGIVVLVDWGLGRVEGAVVSRDVVDATINVQVLY